MLFKELELEIKSVNEIISNEWNSKKQTYAFHLV